MGDLYSAIFTEDGNYKDGTPSERPNTTPAELDMDPLVRAILPNSPQEDSAGWFNRQYDRLAYQNAKPGDNIAQSVWGEVSEAGSSFMSGLRRSRYNYAQAAQNSAEFVADKFGLQFDARRDFLAASINKWKNMQINPTTDEWEDQLFYLLGNLAPDAISMVLGGGIVGGAVSLGVKAAGWSKSAATIATVLGRISGDTGANVVQGMIHEAGQAEIDGRDAEYARAGKEALAMGALMSVTGRSAKAFGLSRKSTALLTGATLGGVTSLYYDDNDPGKGDAVAANAVLGGLFGLAVPQTGRVGSADIRTWVKFKRESGQAPTSMSGWMGDFFGEFLPETYDKVWRAEPDSESKLYTGYQKDPNYVSPKDEFLMFLDQTTKTDSSGYNDNNLINLIADLETTKDMQLGEYRLLTQQADAPGAPPKPAGQVREPQFEIRTGLDRASALKHAKVIMDSINEVDTVWMKDHPKYEPRVVQPHTPPVYKRRMDLKKVSDKEKADGVLVRDENGKPLEAHELSWSEYASIVGDTDVNKQFHRSQIQRAAEEFNPKKSSKLKPNKGGLIEHDMWGDYGYIHSRPSKGFPKQPVGKTARMIVESEKNKIIANREDASDGVKQVLSSTKGPFGEKIYRWFVDPAGRFFNELEKRGMLPVRNALQLQSLKKGKTTVKLEELDTTLDFARMTPEEDAILTSYIFLKAELDNVKRLGMEKATGEEGVRRQKVYRTTQIKEALALLEDDAANIPGGWAKLEGKINYVQNLFADMFTELKESGIIGDNTYNLLKDYKYTPQKTIKEALGKYEDHLLKRGKKSGDLDQTDKALHDLMADADLKGKNTNLQAITHEHVSSVYSMSAKNRLLTEMAKTESEFWALDKPQRIGAEDLTNFERHTFMREGTETPIWIEKKVSTLLEAKNDRMLGADAATAIRFFSGVHPIQITAVATNPFFAIFTHPLDFFSIATHHQALPKFIPTLVKQMYVHNAETGAFPMFANFMHAWKKDKVFKDYVENDGTISTIVSSVSADEMVRRSTNIMDQGKISERSKRGWNNFIQTMGKFGHTMEVAMRMTETDMLVKTGKYSRKEAAHESLRRLNYNRRGELMHLIDSVVPFANAQAQILVSQMNEIKTVKGAVRVASTIGQLTLGIALTRVLIEEHFPGYMKDIPWEARMRYWIFPTGAKEIDHESGQEIQHYFKIKKAYNPWFMMANVASELAMDAYYYGEDGMPPISIVEAMWDGIKVATPVELQNNIPPAAKAFLAYKSNMDINGRPVYKGPQVEARDEINTELMGMPTHNASILAGQLTSMSPARLQASYGSYIAQNPLAWVAGSFLETPPEASVSAMTQIVKGIGVRKMLGTTNKKWAEYESGLISQKKAGSSMYHEYYSKMVRPLARLYSRDIGSKGFINEVRGILKDSKPHIKIKMLGVAKSEIKAKAFMDKLLKQHTPEDVYDYMQPYSFWHNALRINDPSYRAGYIFDRYQEIDDPAWRKNFIRMVAYRGFFQDKFFAAEFREFQKEE